MIPNDQQLFFAAFQRKKNLPEEIRGTVIQADKKIEEMIKCEEPDLC